MKNYLKILCFLIVLLVTKFSFGQVLFETILDENGIGEAKSICVASDGGFVVLGKANPTGTFGGTEIFIAKYDEDFNRDWLNFYGEINVNDYGVVIRNTETGYLVTSNSENPNLTSTDHLVLSIDFDGNEIWSNYYGESSCHSEYFYDVLSYSGYYLMAGTECANLYTMKLDLAGNEIGENHYGNQGYIYRIKEEGDRVVACGSLVRNDSVVSFLMLLDTNGLELNRWEGNVNQGRFEDVYYRNDSIVAVGWQRSEIDGLNEAVVEIFDLNLEKISEFEFDSGDNLKEYIYNIEFSNLYEGGVFAGNFQDIIASYETGYLAFVSDDFNLESYYQIGNSQASKRINEIILQDNKIVTVGYYDSGSNFGAYIGVYDYELTKIASVSESPFLNKEVEIWPNPFRDKLFIKSDEMFDEFQISDLSGRVIMKGQLNENEINFSSLKQGTYFISFIKNNTTVLSKKIIKSL